VPGRDSTNDEAEDGERVMLGRCGEVWTKELMRDGGQYEDDEEETEKAEVRQVDGVSPP